MKATVPLLALALSAAAAPAQAPVVYELSFPRAEHHEAVVSATFPDLPRGPLEVRMSRTSPGRYSLQEFAKNVYDLRAEDGRGRPLRVARQSAHAWRVEGHDGTARVTYTLFGRTGDGTHVLVDGSHAHLNGPATFLRARGLERRPVRVTLRPPAPGWKVATQLAPTADPYTFTAPDWAYLADSPVEASVHDTRSWEAASGGRPYTFRLAVQHSGSAEEVDRFAGWVRAIADEAAAVFGEWPAFEGGGYTWIADFLPWMPRDAMEHRNSSVLTGPVSPGSPDAVEYAVLAGHELFHAWNVERLRPRSLEPFDFDDVPPAGELWFVEGFSDYYDDLLARRAGVTDTDAFAAALGASLNFVVTSPALGRASPVEMSLLAAFGDGAALVDATNLPNTYLSHYEGGLGVALGLDVAIRTRFPGRSLDDYMRAMWTAHGRREVPYTLGDMKRVLGQVTDRAFAEDFFARYVEGRDTIDFERALAPAGLLLRPAAPGQPAVGLALEEGEERATVAVLPLEGSPARAAGLTAGDEIASVAGRAVRGLGDLRAVLAGRKPGEVLPVEFVRRGEPRRTELTLGEVRRMEVVTYEAAGLPVSDEARAFREAWLGSRAKGAAR